MNTISENFFNDVKKNNKNVEEKKSYFIFKKNDENEYNDIIKDKENKLEKKEEEVELNLDKNIKFFEEQKQKYIDDVNKIYELVIKKYKEDPNRSAILNDYDVEYNFKTLLFENNEVWYEINEYLNHLKSLKIK